MNKVICIKEQYQSWDDYRSLDLRDRLIFDRLFPYLFHKKKITDTNAEIADDLADLESHGVKITPRTVQISIGNLEAYKFLVRQQSTEKIGDRFFSARSIYLSGERFTFVKEKNKFVVELVNNN